ncbi:MAG: acyl-CoA dehydrogenase family protein [Rhodococcus fascians]|uniref:acyl-CoA dehydrogenase family protein n=1 Tax=Nocardiaceae TaxID=85025 RepID=UPI00037935B4|nr:MULTISPECIES: acyl-CoA dehydrogenase family protein [Rhodococcus]OZC54669.1 acyl-CoA dehydrogenase [Rhodococcus sp. 06-621-2]OZD14763.1 acyl-CoA dehydrogenase [Rhodococcus sp. 06-156-4C]OZD20161.1 acyl-CoA dehydrogenase [Rhodococcus sp. 06-156-4a]OZD22535.1 acyl-CoA dehydrogenase [Rhodococcus sp. 06-156-3C]OZD26179.1 acyl-CoA dehydrogenase [Rhodococcus sp. 06-156-3b]
MSIDLTYSPQVQTVIDKTRTFVRETVLPIEDKFLGNIADAGGDELRISLQQAAKDAGVFAPHAPVEYGGLGLNMSDRAPVFEEGGYSLFGPAALNIGAPDEGNVHMLAHIASQGQKEQFLAPLASGDVRSAFAMTEPAPGAGSDPSALTTAAVKVDGGWKVDGQKYFITGADGAGFFIIMARTAGKPGDRGGATMFLAPADTPGIKVGRHIGTLDKAMIGGHCEVFFDSVFVPDENVLGAVDEGFSYAQVRLGPARMTHVMRWLGAARRGHDIAVDHVARREGFGSTLGDLGMVQKMVADNEIDIAATRALLVQACFALDQGSHAGNETSIAKTYAAEAIFRIVDRSIQMCGGLGVSDDLPLARLSREVRPFRVYDGPSEVHRWAIAKRVVGAAKKAARQAADK